MDEQAGKAGEACTNSQFVMGEPTILDHLRVGTTLVGCRQQYGIILQLVFSECPASLSSAIFHTFSAKCYRWLHHECLHRSFDPPSESRCSCPIHLHTKRNFTSTDGLHSAPVVLVVVCFLGRFDWACFSGRDLHCSQFDHCRHFPSFEARPCWSGIQYCRTFRFFSGSCGNGDRLVFDYQEST